MYLKRPVLDQYTAGSRSFREILIKCVNIDYSREWSQMNRFPKPNSFIRDTLNVSDINNASYPNKEFVKPLRDSISCADI